MENLGPLGGVFCDPPKFSKVKKKLCKNKIRIREVKRNEDGLNENIVHV